MAEDAAPTSTRTIAAVMLLAFFLVFVPSWYVRGPWHIDELRYVEAARQMGEYGDYMVGRLNGEVYGEKPPGFSWAVIAMQRVTQQSYHRSAQMVATLAALLTGLLLVHLGRLLFRSPLAGWLGAGFFWTTLFIVDRGSRAFIDSLLYFWTTAGVVTLLHAALATRVKQRALWIAASCAALAGGCLTKGPVALLLPALGAPALGLLWQRRRGISFTALPVAALVGGLVTLLWLWLASQSAGEEYFNRLAFKQTAGRVAETGQSQALTGHHEPIWFYLAAVAPVLLPWLAFLPGTIRQGWRERADPQARAALGLLLWAGLILVVFSLFSGKRAGYVLPMVPPLALALGWGVLRIESRGLLRVPAMALLALLAGAGALVTLASPLPAILDASTLPARLDWVAAMHWQQILAIALAGVTACAGGVYLLRLVRQGAAPATAMILLVPVLAGVIALGNAGIVSALNAENSSDSFGEQVQQRWIRSEPLVVLGAQKDGIENYYTNRQRSENLSPQELAARTGPLWVIALRKDWERLPEPTRKGFINAGASRFNNNDYWLMHRP